MTTKQAHTPGPWVAHGPYGGGLDCRVTLDIARSDKAISGGVHAVVHSLHVTPEAREIALADARLIAAAPDLLAALEDALVYISGDHPEDCDLCGGGPVGGIDYSPRCACFGVRSAIAKARP